MIEWLLYHLILVDVIFLTGDFRRKQDIVIVWLWVKICNFSVTCYSYAMSSDYF